MIVCARKHVIVFLYIYVHVYMYIYIYIDIDIDIDIYIHMQINTCTHICVHKQKPANAWACWWAG